MEVSVFTSGSCGNCTYISSNGTSILIDVGLSRRYLVNALKAYDRELKDINGICLTHEHIDHVKGVPSISTSGDIPIYSTTGTWSNLKMPTGVKTTLASIKDDNIRCFSAGAKFIIGGLTVETFSISHDASDPVGYRITDEHGFSCALVTDTGIVTKCITDGMKNANVIVMESNYDVDMLMKGKYPYYLKKRISSPKGHLSNEACGQNLLDMIGPDTKHIYLAHMSAENNDPYLAKDTVRNMLNEGGVCVEKDVSIKLTKRYEVSDSVRVGDDFKVYSVAQGRLFV